MSSIIELPEPLAREVERRAAQEGRSVADILTDWLADGAPVARPAELAGDVIVAKALPLMKVQPVPMPPGPTMGTQEWCDWIKRIDSQLDAERHETTPGRQHLDRADA